MLVDISRLLDAARADFEFCRETRYLNGTLSVTIGADTTTLEFNDGKLAGIGGPAGGRHVISVGGTTEQWEALLADRPKPFYQCLQSAAVRHGMTLSSTDETFAYLPALNRLTTLMRAVKSGRI
ncbi:hypothetical protein [Mesorhizobium sp. M0006]|uniref:hypothetical protein n=1 Tax=Mesorhizobium sp. M0006 TaxID=2956838 RepID=UPI00333CEDCA